jgi:hypothetical protein
MRIPLNCFNGNGLSPVRDSILFRLKVHFLINDVSISIRNLVNIRLDSLRLDTDWIPIGY